MSAIVMFIAGLALCLSVSENAALGFSEKYTIPVFNRNLFHSYV